MNPQTTDKNVQPNNPEPSNTVLNQPSAKLLSQLGLKGTNLIAAISYQETKIPKQGMDLWLTKLPIIKQLTPFKSQYRQLDLDLSCVLLDDNADVIKTIWFGDLGEDNIIYHMGDGLFGAKNFEEHLINQEEIHIRLPLLLQKIPKAAYILFFISSFYHHPLYQAKKGVIKLMDNEGNILHKLPTNQIEKQTDTLLLWQLTKIDNDFLLSTPNIPLQSNNTSAQSFIKSITDFSKKHIALEKNNSLI